MMMMLLSPRRRKELFCTSILLLASCAICILHIDRLTIPISGEQIIWKQSSSTKKSHNISSSVSFSSNNNNNNHTFAPLVILEEDYDDDSIPPEERMRNWTQRSENQQYNISSFSSNTTFTTPLSKGYDDAIDRKQMGFKEWENHNTNLSSIMKISYSSNNTTTLLTPEDLLLFEDYNPTLRRVWKKKCGSGRGQQVGDYDDYDEIHNKLIFVHIFKTAGSSFRDFFTKYAYACNKGVTLLVGCAHMKPPTTTSEIWNPCTLKYALNRRKHGVNRKKVDLNFNVLPSLETDIMMGHLSIGLDRNWVERDGQQIRPQYVTFFREPIHKYISGRVYVWFHEQHQKYTYAETLEKIKKGVYDRISKKEYYEVYSNYLLTPWQTSSALANRTELQKVELIKQNLVQLPILVGIVEEMDDSLDLLQYTLNDDPTSNKLLKKMNSKKGVRNEGVLSTSKLLAELEKDIEFMENLREVLKFEFILYEFAQQLHKRQVDWLRGQKQRDAARVRSALAFLDDSINTTRYNQ